MFLQQLALLKGFDLAAMDPMGPDFVHTIIECSKLAFADREVFYGDPAFAHVPMDVLLSDAYNDARRRLIDPRSASMEVRPGSLGECEQRAARIVALAGKKQSGGGGQGEMPFAPLP